MYDIIRFDLATFVRWRFNSILDDLSAVVFPVFDDRFFVCELLIDSLKKILCFGLSVTDVDDQSDGIWLSFVVTSDPSY